MAEPSEWGGPDEVAYGVVMPFVVCQSKGGPYEDQAFVAGYECGLIDAALERGETLLAQTVRTDSLPQLDLIAMRHGWAMLVSDSGTEGWSFVDFYRADNGGDAS